MDYISAHLTDNPSLDEVARAANFSRFHFHRLFKQLTGETVAEFVRRLRLEYAAGELSFDPDVPITQLAMDHGFSTSQNFAKAFKRHFGMSPGEFRDKQRALYADRKRGTMERNPEAARAAVWEHVDGVFRQRSPNMDIEIKKLDPQHVAYVRHVGPYESAGEHAFGALTRWAGPRGLLGKGPLMGVGWDNPEITPPDKCRYDACVAVPEGTETSGEVGTSTIEGGDYAVYRCQIPNDGFAGAYDAVFAWLPDSGYQPASHPCYEVYLNASIPQPGELWDVEIRVPVVPL